MAPILEGVILAFLMRALVLGLTLKWKTGGTDRILLANVVSWVLCSAIYGVRIAGDRLVIYWSVLGFCGIYQLLWLVFDNVRFAKGRGPEPDKSMAAPPTRPDDI